MAESFRVDLHALEEAAAGVNGVLDEISVRKVSSIPHAASAIGHDGLAGTLSDFLGRWERGVDNLAKDGQEIASRLTANVNAYHRVDQAAQHELDGILQGMGTDPGAQ